MEFVGLFLDKTNPSPLYAQLYNYFVEQIRSGALPAGERLPGKRTAAAQLGVSVNTVDEAYQMLAAEGYVHAQPRSGFRVNRLEQLIPPPAAPAPGPDAPKARAHWQYSFLSGDIDPALFPRKTWNRLHREVLAQEEELFTRGPAFGDPVLLNALAAYLQGYRGVQCDASQIVAGAGLEVLTGLLARLFVGQTAAVENPGYPKTSHVLRNEGIAVTPVDVDSDGMIPALLQASGAGLAYLTPSHQFPTGGVMPVGRRTELLRWAAQGGHYIIEDDYDSEFRFDGRPLPCLQGLDESGHVVYAGTFSRSLAPGLRVAYLVLPPALLHRWKAAYGDYACTVSRPEQHTLARLMQGGHFARGLNRMRAAYKLRRGLVLQHLEAQLAPLNTHIENAHTGLYFILRLPRPVAVKAAAAARAAGIGLRAMDEYRSAPPSPGTPTANALVIGYGGLPDSSIPQAVHALAQIIQSSLG